ncbi:MAG: ATP synthase F1 subunit delta [candidate division Zixibacteria bacterium]|nr:ATP synthase F1 subunit delta [candidate division Zixibacteria bacterium]
MKETRVARRYALALFKTSLDGGNLDIVASDIQQIRSLTAKDKNFLNFLEAPQITTEHKIKVLRETFTTRLAQRLLLFLELLLKKHRTNLLPVIADEFEKLMEEHLGLIKAKVFTATYLSDDLKDRLVEKLEAYSGKKIEIIHKIDESIIGGIIVFLHNQVIDRSIKHQIDVLKQNLLKVKVY